MVHNCFCCGVVFLFKQNTADELRISVLSSDVFSSDLTADFGRELPDLLLVEAADLDRGLIGSLDLEAFGHVKIDIVAVAKLQLQRPALRLEERRGGTECVWTCRSRWSLYHQKRNRCKT